MKYVKTPYRSPGGEKLNRKPNLIWSLELERRHSKQTVSTVDPA